MADAAVASLFSSERADAQPLLRWITLSSRLLRSIILISVSRLRLGALGAQIAIALLVHAVKADQLKLYPSSKNLAFGYCSLINRHPADNSAQCATHLKFVHLLNIPCRRVWPLAPAQHHGP
ncbi:MAG: hypothetical protein GPOALKHO_001316 [Sodalis sp.]|nr:MAG: hypothetical protein GPOALKHO_001316 [Sodalis sp.]